MEEDPTKAILKIIDLGREKFPSEIWREFENMDIERDIQEAQIWLDQNLKRYPDFSGIYLGLDTLNMEQGHGINIEIGISKSCDPQLLDDEWAYECENYGNPHLIKGLFEVADCFNNQEKWTYEERNFTEYLIFLGYSGIILKEALTNLNIENDYLSLWGFHDGDMFFLTQKIGNMTSIVTEIDV